MVSLTISAKGGFCSWNINEKGITWVRSTGGYLAGSNGYIDITLTWGQLLPHLVIRPLASAGVLHKSP